MKSLTLSELSFVIFDLETTGLYADSGDQMIEVGAVRVKALEIEKETFQSLVKPTIPIPKASSDVHGITDKDVANAPEVSEVIPEFIQYCGNRIWVAQNARFDLSFILRDMRNLNLPFRQSVVLDTIGISKILFPYETRHNLDVMMARMGIAKTGDRHRSLDDCKFTAQVLIEFIKLLKNQGIETLNEVESAFIKVDTVLKPEKPKPAGLFA